MKHFDAGVRHWLVQLTLLFGEVREWLDPILIALRP